MTTRRRFLKMSATIGAGTLFLVGEEAFQMLPRVFASVQVPQTPLPGGSIQPFVEPLPTFVGKRVSATTFTVRMQEFQQQILPASFYAQLKPPFDQGTYLWGYQVDNRPVSYPGFTVEAHRDVTTTITYVNDLPYPNSVVERLLTIDQTLHWADPLMRGQSYTTDPYTGPIPTVSHLHGGQTPPAFDGTPNQWFTSTGLHGKAYATLEPTAPNSAIYQYPNPQEATALMFHDHTLGITRTNVYAGLVNGYLIRDQYDTGLPNNPLRLPSGEQEIELVMQDRQFDTNGQMLFPDGHPCGLGGECPPHPDVHPYWIPDFLGDVIAVNGKSWPYLNVEPRRYRLRFFNVANARFFRMFLVNNSRSDGETPVFWQIGTDGGLLDLPVQLDNSPFHDYSRGDPRDALFLAPGERADTIIDFTNFAGQTITLHNDAPAPYPRGMQGTLDPNTSGLVMQFRVNLPLSSPDTSYNPASGEPLRGGNNQEPLIVRLVNPQTGTLANRVRPSVRRGLVLNENPPDSGDVQYPTKPIEILLNNTKWHEPPTELPRVGSTEVWEVYNCTPDAHPIHIHLIQFQLLNRQYFKVDEYLHNYQQSFFGGTYKSEHGPSSSYTRRNKDRAIGGNPGVRDFLSGAIIPPDANEAGWKDTVKMYPNQVTRIVARWAPLDVPVNGVRPGQNLYPFDPTVSPGYVWHCHITDHEDNEMMRPYSPIW